MWNFLDRFFKAAGWVISFFLVVFIFCFLARFMIVFQGFEATRTQVIVATRGLDNFVNNFFKIPAPREGQFDGKPLMMLALLIFLRRFWLGYLKDKINRYREI